MTSTVLSLIVVTWDGKSEPFQYIVNDGSGDSSSVAALDFLLFDYSGKSQLPPDMKFDSSFISHKTECKGQVFNRVYEHVKDSNYKYISIFDDDIEISISKINKLLSISQKNNLSSFQASLSHDSSYSLEFTKNVKNELFRVVDWVEVMMPFYDFEMFITAGRFYQYSISSYGFDQFVMPLMQKILNKGPAAVIDAVTARHNRPITSHMSIFSNGKTALQERNPLRKKCIKFLVDEYPHLVGTVWFYKTMAPLNSLARFWLTYLAFPWHQIIRLFKRPKQKSMNI